MTPPYVLTQAAEADLRDIIRYTRREWDDANGPTRMGRRSGSHPYRQIKKKGFERIATGGEGRIIDMTAVYPGLWMIRCGHHSIFCLPRRKAPALIVAILHERMDLMARLADRFGISAD